MINLESDLKGLYRSATQAMATSLSHGPDHIDKVLSYAEWLQDIYGGNWRVIAAAAITHDLGRTNKRLHGEGSRLISVSLAKELLESLKFPVEEIAAITECIADHDQPRFIPPTLESKIVKDADFLAGMGALGIVRGLVWSVESGEDRLLQRLDERLSVRMLQRISGLSFDHSRQLATQRYHIVQEFLSALRQEVNFGGS